MISQSRTLHTSCAPTHGSGCAQERPIDLVHLARQTLGDSELEGELLGLFEHQAGLIMGQIMAASTGGERAYRRDLAHTLYGSASAIGAQGVAAAARAYEDALSTPVTEDAISEARDDLGAAVQLAQAAVADLLAGR